MCADAMKNPALFYTQNLVNYQGICSDAQVPYTEIIAEFLIDHLPEFTDGITQDSPHSFLLHTDAHGRVCPQLQSHRRINCDEDVQCL